MEIVADIESLYIDLVNVGFGNFILTTECARYCVSHKLTSYLVNAKNAEQDRINSDTFLFDEMNGDAVLEDFLSDLFFREKDSLLEHVSALLEIFLSWTGGFLQVGELIKDLETLKANEEQVSRVKEAFESYDKNFEKKVHLIYDMTWSAIESNPTDNGAYAILRSQLVKSYLSGSLPEIVHQTQNLHECRKFLQKFKHYQERRSYLQAEFKPLFDVFENNQVSHLRLNLINSI